jgi:hypothetical protein
MAKKDATTGERMTYADEAEVTPQGERPDEPSAFPKDYTPLPFPGWRWHETTGVGIVVADAADDVTHRAEGYTEKAPPQAATGPVVPEVEPQ